MSENNSIPQTPEEMLNQVNDAIYKVLVGGQSYKIGSRQLTRADANLLYSMRNDLITQINSNSNGGLLDNTYVAVFEGR